MSAPTTEQVAFEEATKAWPKQWAIVSDGHRDWLGYSADEELSALGLEMADNTLVHLSPAYEYLSQYQMVQQAPGQPPAMAKPIHVMPIDLIVSSTRVTVRPHAFRRVDWLDPGDQAELLKKVHNAEKNRDEMREQRRQASAAAAGILIAPANTRLPPIPGR